MKVLHWRSQRADKYRRPPSWFSLWRWIGFLIISSFGGVPAAQKKKPMQPSARTYEIGVRKDA